MLNRHLPFAPSVVAGFIPLDDDPAGVARRWFSADVTGDDVRRGLHGPAEFGWATAADDAPAFGIALGGDRTASMLGFMRSGAERPRAGVYALVAPTEAPLDPETLAVVYTFSDGKDAGFFTVRSGALTITASSVNRVAGRFTMAATGILLSAPGAPMSLTIEGSFDAGRRLCGSVLQLGSGR